MRKTKLILLSLIGILLAWVFITPGFEFPDEQAHITSINFLVNENRMPHGQEKDHSQEIIALEKTLGTFRDERGNNKHTYHPEYTINYTETLKGKKEQEIKNLNTKNAKNTYSDKEGARYPLLYYLLESTPYRLFYKSNLFIRIFTLRLFNLSFVLLTAIFSYKIGLELFKKRKYALTLSALTILQPMMTFISSGVNSDNLHVTLFTVATYLSLKVINQKVNLKILLFSGLVIGIDILTKPQGILLAVLFTVAFALNYLQNKTKSKTKLLKKIALKALIVFLPIAYLGRSRWIRYLKLIFRPNFTGASLSEHLKFSLNKLFSQNLVWYWGVFKWLGVVLPRWSWNIANRIVLLSGVGVLVYFYKKLKLKNKSLPKISNILFLIFVTVLYVAAIFWADWSHVKLQGFSLGIQARYYFPTISAHMALLLTGIVSLSWNDRVKEIFRKLLVLFMFIMQLVGLYTLASSYYTLWPISTFITQASQYKPFFVKGSWWYLWIFIYFASLITLLKITLFPVTSRNDTNPES